MRALLVALALLLAVPAARACEDVLIGDSIAVGMEEFASRDGFRVIAVGGVRLSWVERQDIPPCVRHMVLVIGTNDLRHLAGEVDALDYVRRVEALIAAWRPRRAAWVSPSCFDARRNPTLHRGSAILQPAVRKFRARAGWSLVDGGAPPCPSLTRGDGVHPDGEAAERWWRRAHGRVVSGAGEEASSVAPRALAATSVGVRAPAPRSGPVDAGRGRGEARSRAGAVGGRGRDAEGPRAVARRPMAARPGTYQAGPSRSLRAAAPGARRAEDVDARVNAPGRDPR